MVILLDTRADQDIAFMTVMLLRDVQEMDFGQVEDQLVKVNLQMKHGIIHAY